MLDALVVMYRGERGRREQKVDGEQPNIRVKKETATTGARNKTWPTTNQSDASSKNLYKTN